MRGLCCCHWAVPATFCAPVNLTCLTLSPYSAIPNFCALASDLPMPHALVALAANWAGGKDDIVMIPARWRCEISEALGPGHPARPLQVHTHSLSWPFRCRNPHHLAEGATPTTVLPRYLPAIAQPFRIRSPLSKHIK